MQGDALFDNLLTKQTYSPADINYVIGHFITGKKPPFILLCNNRAAQTDMD